MIRHWFLFFFFPRWIEGDLFFGMQLQLLIGIFSITSLLISVIQVRANVTPSDKYHSFVKTKIIVLIIDCKLLFIELKVTLPAAAHLLDGHRMLVGITSFWTERNETKRNETTTTMSSNIFVTLWGVCVCVCTWCFFPKWLLLLLFTSWSSCHS